MHLGVAYVSQCLSWYWQTVKHGKVDWVSLCKPLTNLALWFEAANAGTVTGSRINDQDWRAIVSCADLGVWMNAQQCVVDRAIKFLAINHDIKPKIKHWGGFTGLLLNRQIATLAQDIEKQRGALTGILPIGRQMLVPIHGVGRHQRELF